jgi:hypothetical protein
MSRHLGAVIERRGIYRGARSTVALAAPVETADDGPALAPGRRPTQGLQEAALMAAPLPRPVVPRDRCEDERPACQTF